MSKTLYAEWAEDHDLLRQGHQWRADPTEGQCRSCGAEVMWVSTEKGKAMPIDPDPERYGRFCFTGEIDDLRRPVVHYQRNDEALDGRLLYKSHFATCPERQTKAAEPPLSEAERNL